MCFLSKLVYTCVGEIYRYTYFVFIISFKDWGHLRLLRLNFGFNEMYSFIILHHSVCWMPEFVLNREVRFFAMMCTEYLSTFWYKYYLHFDIHINYLFVYWCSNSRRFNARVNSKAQFLSAYCNLVGLRFSFWTELLNLTIQITIRHRLRVSIVQLDYSDLSFPKFKICYNIRWNKQ